MKANIQAWLAGAKKKNKRFVLNSEIQNADGTPLHFEVQAIENAINDRISAQAETKGKHDAIKYRDLVIVHSVVSPDMNNAELQEALGTEGDAVATLKAFLSAGDYINLAAVCMEHNGFNKSLDDLVGEAKN